MHGAIGLHSALAVKRQRRLREEKRRAKERERRSSSPTNSMDSLDPKPTSKKRRAHQPAMPEHSLGASIGMLHLGVVFFFLGIFLIGSGLLPDDMVSWGQDGYWNELVATGVFVACLGIFLIILNRVLGKKEEADLENYVQQQLTRSRSGHRLERDVETGCLTTKHHRRQLEKKREDLERGFDPDDDIAKVHSPPQKSPPLQLIAVNGDAPLDKIIEEDISEKGEEECRRMEMEMFIKETMSTTTTASLSPGTPSETRELLSNSKMIGAMPAVAVRHERRKGQEKRSKRPSQLFLGGHWLPPPTPSPTPSPNGMHTDSDDRLPEYYVCGKVSALQIVVGSLLLGAIVLVVGLVQLAPRALDADHRYILLGTGSALLILGLVMTAIRCCCMHCSEENRGVPEDHTTPSLDAVNSIDVLVQRRDTQITSPSELDALISKGQASEGRDTNSDCET